MNGLTLAPFASLIQLWAGICLLFFYEPILEKFPLVKAQNEKEKLLKSFLGKSQAFLDESALNKGYKLLDNNWSLFYRTIQNFATIGFFYSVFLLCFIGIENIDACSEKYKALQIMDVSILLYSLTAWLIYKTKWLKGFTCAIIFSALLCIFFHHFETVNSFCIRKNIVLGHFWEKSDIHILTLFTCLSGAFISFIQILIQLVRLSYLKYRLGKVNATIDVLASFLIGETKSSNFPTKLQEKAAKHFIKNEMDPASINQFAKAEIKNIYNSFVNPWYVNLYHGMIAKIQALYSYLKRK